MKDVWAREKKQAERETEERGVEDRVTRTRWMENKRSSGKSEGSWVMCCSVNLMARSLSLCIFKLALF